MVFAARHPHHRHHAGSAACGGEHLRASQGRARRAPCRRWRTPRPALRRICGMPGTKNSKIIAPRTVSPDRARWRRDFLGKGSFRWLRGWPWRVSAASAHRRAGLAIRDGPHPAGQSADVARPGHRIAGSIVVERGVDVDVERTVLGRRIARQPPADPRVDHIARGSIRQLHAQPAGALAACHLQVHPRAIIEAEGPSRVGMHDEPRIGRHLQGPGLIAEPRVMVAFLPVAGDEDQWKRLSSRPPTAALGWAPRSSAGDRARALPGSASTARPCRSALQTAAPAAVTGSALTCW